MAGKGGIGRKTSAKKVQATERQLKALDLRKRGQTYREIGAALGIAEPTAYRLVAKALGATAAAVAESAAELLQIEVERLDADLALIDKQIQGGGTTSAGVPIALLALDRRIRIAERRAKLLGLEAPQRHEHTIDSGDEARARIEEALARRAAAIDGVD